MFTPKGTDVSCVYRILQKSYHRVISLHTYSFPAFIRNNNDSHYMSLHVTCSIIYGNVIQYAAQAGYVINAGIS